MRGLQVSVNGTLTFTAASTEIVGAALVGTREGHRIAASGCEGDELLLWEGPWLELGDEVAIKVVEVESSDPPQRRHPRQR